MGSDGREQKGKDSGNFRRTRKYMRGDREVVSQKAWVWGGVRKVAGWWEGGGQSPQGAQCHRKKAGKRA